MDPICAADPFEDMRIGSSKSISEFVRSGSSKRMSEFAKHVYDTAKQKANKSGNKHVRLQSVERVDLEGEAVTLERTSSRDGGSPPDDRPSALKMVGGCIGTVAVAALIFAIFLALPSSASPSAPSFYPAPSSYTPTGMIEPISDISGDETAVADAASGQGEQMLPISGIVHNGTLRQYSTNSPK
jgi:hypothetical protein